MNASRDESLRPGRLEFSRLSWALALSLVAHLLCYSGYELGKKYNLWNLIQLPPWLTKIMTASVPQPTEPKEEEIPLIFVDVNPQAATPEADAQKAIRPVQRQDRRAISVPLNPATKGPRDHSQPPYLAGQAV